MKVFLPSGCKWYRLMIYGLAVFLFYGCSRTGTLISNGQSDYKIFVSANAIAPEQYAARLLQAYLYRISGCRLEITHEARDHEQLICLGFRDIPAGIVKRLDTAGFANEAYIIRSDGKSLWIAGGGTRGTLYGVIGYLSDYLGCRWYTPEVEKIPAHPVLTLSVMEDRRKPAFSYRDMDWRESLDTAWVIHNRLNGMNVGDSLGGSYITFPFVHTFYSLVSPDKYFHTHPEYFSMVNGRRVGKDAQLCLTNPEVVKIATATVFNWIKTHPEASVFSIDQNDGEGHCECERCTALDEKEGSHAGSLLTFVNQIADSVAKVYPAVKLQTLAYDYTVVPPRNVRPAANVMIRLCHYNYCAAHPLKGCAVNKPFIDQLDQWKRIAKGRITVWDYYTDFRNYLLPFPNFGSFSKDIKFYADNGVKGLFAEGNANGGAGEFAALRSWVIAQLMWDPEQDAGQLVNEFVNAVYGPAAPYITAYIRLLHDQVKPDTHFSIWAEPYEINSLNQPTILKADSLFALARKASAGDTALAARVDLAYLPVLYTKLYYCSQGGTAYINRQALPAALSRFDTFVDQYHITGLGADVHTYGNVAQFRERVQVAKDARFYTDWWLIGPFDNTDHLGLQRTYPPEQEFDTTKTYAGMNGVKLKWKKYNDNITGYIDFKKIFTPGENVVAYARGTITLPEAQNIRFGVGNNDGIRIWINGRQVFNLAIGSIPPNSHIFTARLNKGENTILVKVDQLRHGWGFYFAQLL